MVNQTHKKPYGRFRTPMIYFLIGILFLVGMSLHAWMEADEHCRKRWTTAKLATKYEYSGCMVEVSPDVWVEESTIEPEIVIRYKERW